MGRMSKCLGALALIGVFALLMVVAVEKDEEERVHKLPTDDHGKHPKGLGGTGGGAARAMQKRADGADEEDKPAEEDGTDSGKQDGTGNNQVPADDTGNVQAPAPGQGGNVQAPDPGQGGNQGSVPDPGQGGNQGQAPAPGPGGNQGQAPAPGQGGDPANPGGGAANTGGNQAPAPGQGGNPAPAPDDGGNPAPDTGGDPANPGGGAANTGGGAANTGGDPANTGGDPSNPGGGAANTGGDPANTGGDPANPGGGAANTGGGAANTGGGAANTGGDPANPGGGAANTGGDPANPGTGNGQAPPGVDPGDQTSTGEPGNQSNSGGDPGDQTDSGGDPGDQNNSGGDPGDQNNSGGDPGDQTSTGGEPGNQSNSGGDPGDQNNSGGDGGNPAKSAEASSSTVEAPQPIEGGESSTADSVEPVEGGESSTADSVEPIEGGESSVDPVQPVEGDGSTVKPPQPIGNLFEAKTDFFVKFDGKNCYVGKDEDEANNNKMQKKSPVNGKLHVRQKEDNSPGAFPNCLAEFNKRAVTNTCGTNAYDRIAYCLKVKFFGKNGIEWIKDHQLMERKEQPKSPDEHRLHYMQDQALAIIEGCIRCRDEKIKWADVTIEFVQMFPEGPIKNVCPAEEKSLMTLQLKNVNQDSPGFLLYAVPKERFCVSRPTVADIGQLATFSYKHKFMLKITHNCYGGNQTRPNKMKGVAPKILTLTAAKPIVIDELQNNVFELRGLDINLDDKGPEKNEELVWDDKQEEGIGYLYYKAKVNPTPMVEITPEQQDMLDAEMNKTKGLTQEVLDKQLNSNAWYQDVPVNPIKPDNSGDQNGDDDDDADDEPKSIGGKTIEGEID